MLLNLREASGPLYRRVYHALKAMIRAGRLGPAARLPSTRVLARDLGVSRNTVTLAYEQLAAEGYLVSHHRGTTSVAGAIPLRIMPPPVRPKPDPAPRLSAYARRLVKDPTVPSSPSAAARPAPRYDFRYGSPAVDEFPREIWRRLLAARARRASRESFGYGSPAGYGPLREALSEYSGAPAASGCDAERIVIVNGSQQALDLVSRVLIDPGDGAVVEEPHYSGRHGPLRGGGRAAHPGSRGRERSRYVEAAAGRRRRAPRLRDAVPSVPQRRHHAARAAARAPRLGLSRRRLARRGRLRQRVPLRGPPAGGAPVARPRRPRDLHRHLLEDAVPRAAPGLSRAAARRWCAPSSPPSGRPTASRLPSPRRR